ncbi:MAG: response regulator [Candidatus Magasanikbacteria bacterium CG10_big_fil_rev_8_21_14_0_10_36_32]|uniref:Response regulator n=1 Tax=Candidatus Magasanikbacteria bacterium CG10_big_fil_rev_8_21_14_0_10_36_32 TaxID=1974646 RepID=A0A2M6W5N3_9BACT|nr:MAG: response regulator [Candidatus Magasanikbacteria bacterium CG10_big_fil_rev_8_21_14_0_10_36_32]
MPSKEKIDKPHILLIESDEFLGGIYEKNLLMEDFKVTRAINGERGLKLAETKKPDLILLAVLLPKINGFEILAELKKDNATKNIPVVMLTKLGSKEDVQKGAVLGAADYLIKGHFRPSELVDKVKVILSFF